MDEHIGNSNKIIIDSFHDNKYKVIQAKAADLNKKRKSENEQLFFPLSKHKFGFRNSGFEHEQSLTENEVIHSHLNKGKRVVELAAADESSEVESEKDSNSFVGGSDSAMSGNDENENMLESEYPPQTSKHAQSFISSGSCSSNNSLKDTLHSLRSRIVEEPTVGKKDQFKGQWQFRSGDQFSVDQLQQFEERPDRNCGEYQVDGLEQGLDEELEETMLYSNGPSETDVFVLSSGQWSIGQETRQGPRKPTIDQEFEQYFSALML